MIDLSAVERAYLADLLERRYEELMHELHHASSRRFREGLKEEVDMVEHIRQSFAPPAGIYDGSR